MTCTYIYIYTYYLYVMYMYILGVSACPSESLRVCVFARVRASVSICLRHCTALNCISRSSLYIYTHTLYYDMLYAYIYNYICIYI